MNTLRDFRQRTAEGEKDGDTADSFRFTLEEIKAVVEMVQGSDLAEFKLERGEDKIWVKRGQEPVAPAHNITYIQQPTTQAAASAAPSFAAAPYPAVAAPVAQTQAFAAPASSASAAAAPAPTSATNLYEMKSPMVGTFYRKPAPDSPPYAQVGDIVKKGDVLCIVEAMKLMNEIESEFNGKIVEVRLEDGQMVEYGEVLFRIEPV